VRSCRAVLSGTALVQGCPQPPGGWEAPANRTRWNGHMRIPWSAAKARAGHVRGGCGAGGACSGGCGPDGGAGGGRAWSGYRPDDCGRRAAFRPWRVGWWWCGLATLVLVVILAGSVPTAAGLLAPAAARGSAGTQVAPMVAADSVGASSVRSEEHTSELQSRFELVCRL